MLIISYFHVFILFIVTFYPLIFSIQYDIYYINYQFGLYLSWIICKNECLITYCYKKYNNTNYKLGDRANDMDDIYLIIEKNIYNQYILKIIFCGNIINNIVVFYRNNIELYLILLLNIGFIFYIFNLKLLNIKNINIIFGLILLYVKKMIV